MRCLSFYTKSQKFASPGIETPFDFKSKVKYKHAWKTKKKYGLITQNWQLISAKNKLKQILQQKENFLPFLSCLRCIKETKRRRKCEPRKVLRETIHWAKTRLNYLSVKMSPRSFQKWKSLTKSGLGGISTFDWALYTKRGPVRNNWSKPSVHACRIWHSTKFGPGLFKVNSVEVPRIKRYRQVGWLEQFVR